jgi:SAM-dependent methyltransferase
MTSDDANASFWNEPCGSAFASARGLDVSTIDGLLEFDRQYMAFYPYLEGFLDEVSEGAASVVEVGLGLGTVARNLATRGLQYSGIDVASEPCRFIRASFDVLGLNGELYTRSVLSTTPEDVGGPFDAGVAIGSLHHTGDLAAAVSRFENLVRPGGRVLIMTYGEFTPRRLISDPRRSRRHWADLRSGRQSWWQEEDAEARRAHDANSEGEAPPSTAFASTKAWRSLLAEGTDIRVSRRNFNQVALPRVGIGLSRSLVLKTFGRTWGIDLYVRARRP